MDDDAKRDDRAAEEPSAVDEPWRTQLGALGAFIRTQRLLADLSLREMAAITQVSNAYLSQIERGLHQPSLKVLRSIAEALGLTTDQLLSEVGWLDRTAAEPPHAEPGEIPDTEAAIRADPRLTDAQRQALLGVYRGFVDRSS